jgi:hypothetical protein
MYVLQVLIGEGVAALNATNGWMPHNAGFGFLDRPSATLGQIHF